MARPACAVVRSLQLVSRRETSAPQKNTETDNDEELVMTGRHRAAVETLLERATGSPVEIESLRGLADRWDEIETSGEGGGQIPQLAAVLLSSAGLLNIPEEDALAALEAELMR
jgi:hypothetical protein